MTANGAAPRGTDDAGPEAGAAARSAPRTVSIACDTDIVTARVRGRALALQLGFPPADATLVATTISELARNIVLYATTGTIVIQPLAEGGRIGILIAAHDDGRGIADPARAVAGGYSTSGRLGLGLCGVRRLVDEFEIASRVGSGTQVVVKKWKA